MLGRDSQRYNQRLGLMLFAVYLVLYVGFMLLCAFAPAVMEWRPTGTLNLAILYGFGLIIAALILAVLYGTMCRSETPPSTTTQQPGDSVGGTSE